MYKYLNKTEKENSFSKLKYLINSERYQNYYGTFNGNRIFFKSCYVFDNPIKTYENIKNQMYIKIVDKEMLPYLEILFKVVKFENTWKDYFIFFQKIVNSTSYATLPLKIQVYFNTIFVSSIRGFVFEDNYIKDNNLKSNPEWDVKYKIDAYEEKDETLYLYQIKSYPIEFMIENYEDWNNIIPALKRDYRIEKHIEVYKVFIDGKKKVYEI